MVLHLKEGLALDGQFEQNAARKLFLETILKTFPAE